MARARGAGTRAFLQYAMLRDVDDALARLAAKARCYGVNDGRRADASGVLQFTMLQGVNRARGEAGASFLECASCEALAMRPA